VSRFNKDQGDKGELLAINYLKHHRYKIIERNFRTRSGEIDIIGIDQSEKILTLCFIEVKTRQNNAFGTPLESIGYLKLQAMRRTALTYLAHHPNLPKLLRLDAVSVEISDQPQISLVKNIG
jgi:putative endonuclease